MRIAQENPKRKHFRERTRISVTVFSRKKSERRSESHYKKLKSGYVNHGYTRDGYQFRRYEIHVPSIKALDRIEKLKSQFIPRLKRHEKISLIAQTYKGRITPKTGRIVEGQIGSIIRSVYQRVPKGKRVKMSAQWTRGQARRGFDFIHDELNRYFEYLVDEELASEDELFEQEET